MGVEEAPTGGVECAQDLPLGSSSSARGKTSRRFADVVDLRAVPWLYWHVWCEISGIPCAAVASCASEADDHTASQEGAPAAAQVQEMGWGGLLLGMIS